MVPEGWLELPIGDVCSAIVDCVNKTAPVVEGPTPFRMIRTTNVRHSRVDTENVRYVTEDTFRIWTRRGELRDEDIILTREAPVGEVGQLRDAEGMFLGQRTMVYRADPNRMDQQFLFQAMISPNLQRQYHADSAGGTVAHIRVPDCSKFILNVPPLPEQRKIAEILSTWDRAIEVSEALLATATRQKRALMQQLLTGNRRFPAFEGEAWKTVRLGDLGTFRKGKGIPKTKVGPAGKYPCILYGELYTKYGEIIDKPISFTDLDDGVISKSGDVLIPASTTTTGIDLAIASCVVQDGVRLGGDINIFRASQDQIDGAFLAYFLTHARRHEMARFAQGITIVHLKGSDLLNVSIEVPTLGEQKKIVAMMETSEEEIEQLRGQTAHLRTEKRALMQQLLTGKQRVVV
jgi:type I restriction enzyme S subunit